MASTFKRKLMTLVKKHGFRYPVKINLSKIVKISIATFLSIILSVPVWIGLTMSSTPGVSTFPAKKPQLKGWEEIFLQAQTLSYKVIVAGSITMDRNNLLQYGPEEWAERYKPIPVFSHWISHPIEGDILIDAGLASEFKFHNTGNYTALMSALIWFSKIENTLLNTVVEQLPERGKEIKKVFFTHFHPDHTSGLDDMPADIELIADKKEYDFLARMINGNLFERRSNWYGIDFEEAKPVPPFDHVLDLFGDQSIFAISTPGHTKGHTSYLLNAKEGAILVIGDASHFEYGFQNNLAPKAQGENSSQDAKVSLDQLRTFHQRYPSVRIIWGHEQ
ncbi:MAG: MBL fold metallo-hydrolase [Gammaproteobacteria bacterium]|nr:MBL fold metallo-hydrolase [Gammaproteobacteria bacterium]